MSEEAGTIRVEKEAHSNQAVYGDTFNAGNEKGGEYVLKSVIRRFDYLLH